MKALKLSSGLDVSKSDFHANLVVLQEDQSIKVLRSRKFHNTKKGISDYNYWYRKVSSKYDLPVYHLMEATGAYHELLALSLFKLEEKISIVLPNKSKKYIQALGFKTKNDKTDAKALAIMGAQQNLSLWQPMGDFFYELRAMTRMYQNYQENSTALKNQIEALTYGMYKQTALIKDIESLLKKYAGLLEKLRLKIDKHLSSNEKIGKKVEKICKIKGLSTLSLAVLLGETNGFELFKNQRQLVSYSGYDVIENQSGRHIGRTKISKKGNSKIRRALFMPSFTVVKYEKRFKAFYERIYERTQIKMKAYVAVQKKLLVLVYSLWKNDEAYDPNYVEQNRVIV